MHHKSGEAKLVCFCFVNVCAAKVHFNYQINVLIAIERIVQPVLISTANSCCYFNRSLKVMWMALQIIV